MEGETQLKLTEEIRNAAADIPGQGRESVQNVIDYIKNNL